MTPQRKKVILGTVLIAAVIAAGVFTTFPMLKEHFPRWIKAAQTFTEHNQEVVQELREEIFSSPLKSTKNNTKALLTTTGVIALSNAERTKVGGAKLVENELLNKAAEQKLKDMFDKQYFEHVSPEGNGPGYLAEQANYNYIVVGENLALGNFKNDADLVAAWMASQGHKENILSERFTEIGVAVGQGIYNGTKTWLAVQEFGKPASDCPRIDQALKIKVEQNKERIDIMSDELTKMKAELETMPRTTAEEQSSYNAKVDEYNTMVKLYNEDLVVLRADIEEYNQQVRAFNTCVKK